MLGGVRKWLLPVGLLALSFLLFSVSQTRLAPHALITFGDEPPGHTDPNGVSGVVCPAIASLPRFSQEGFPFNKWSTDKCTSKPGSTELTPALSVLNFSSFGVVVGFVSAGVVGLIHSSKRK